MGRIVRRWSDRRTGKLPTGSSVKELAERDDEELGGGPALPGITAHIRTGLS
jgi:hypothetical protein